MEKDLSWRAFFASNERYADAINGFGCSGEQIVSASDLSEADTMEQISVEKNIRRNASGKNKWWTGARDVVRKAAFGTSFAIIGIENQEEIDYSLPLRNMLYDAGVYEKQAAGIRRKVRKHLAGLSAGEYLYGFRKSDRLYPVVTMILYAGLKEWDAPKSLHEMLK